MKNILSTRENKEKSDIQNLEDKWNNVFGIEYKPIKLENLELMRDFIKKKKEKNSYWNVREYNFHTSPEDFLEELITRGKDLTITELESFPKDQKRALADIILGSTTLTNIHESLGESGLFWIRHYAYSYGHKYEELQEYLTFTSFVGSERNMQLLVKSHFVPRRSHRKDFDILQTLLLFEMGKQLPYFLSSGEIQEYVEQSLGKEWSMQALFSRGEGAYGCDDERHYKDINTKGEEIEENILHHVSRGNYVEGVFKQSVNRDTLDIYKDFSGEQYRIYLDGPFGFAIMKNGKPLATLSFSLSDRETLFIHQMQTVTVYYFDRYGRSEKVAVDPLTQTLPRQKILYDIAVKLAKHYDMRYMEIQGGEKNRRTKEVRTEDQYDDRKKKRIDVPLQKIEIIYDDKLEKNVEKAVDIPHLSMDLAKKIYDTFAANNGFAQNEDGNWEKEIA